jgi:heme-degrading monooxygenase HmoA
MIVALLKTKRRPEAPADEYAALGGRMYELVSAMPGFISAEFFSGEDNQELTVACLESAEALTAWRVLPEHVAAQRRGVEEFYASVSVQICESVRQHELRQGPSGALALVPA